jgi:hypothetical protein
LSLADHSGPVGLIMSYRSLPCVALSRFPFRAPSVWFLRKLDVVLTDLLHAEIGLRDDGFVPKITVILEIIDIQHFED